MKLSDLLIRAIPPQPWAEGDNIPWHEPGFSGRMLHEHLSQQHDAASRRQAKIDQQVQWIHAAVLGGRPSQILDLGCGPGLYAARLARLGHRCVGIDYSPASIRYAQQQTTHEMLACNFLLGDIRTTDFGAGFDLVLLIFGEFNVFKPADARLILRRVHSALASGGLLLLEPHTFEVVRSMGQTGTSWYITRAGLFSEQPHLCLQENFWDAEQAAATIRYYIVDLVGGDVQSFAQSMQAYTNEQYRLVLNECGFDEVVFYPSLIGVEDPAQRDLIAIMAQRLA